MNKICGIYKITSPNNRIYIGQAIDIYFRWYKYKEYRCESQVRLFRSLKKYGWKEHKFEIICECLESELNELEKYYIDLFQTFNTQYGLNLRSGGGHGRHSDETKKKMSESQKGDKNGFFGKKHTPETIKKLSEYTPTEETKKKIGDVHRGKKISDETKKKLSESSKGDKNGFFGKKHTPETIKKIRKANIGKHLSNKTKEKLRIINIGKRHTEKTKDKISKANMGRIFSDIHKKRLSDKIVTNETKNKISESKSFLYLNTQTGIYYLGLKYAADSINMKTTTFSANLTGKTKKNNTPFICV